MLLRGADALVRARPPGRALVLLANPYHRRATLMTFDRPWALLLVLLPIAWAAWEWRLSARRGALLFKAGAFACILLALSAPRLTVYQSKVAVPFLGARLDRLTIGPQVNN